MMNYSGLFQAARAQGFEILDYRGKYVHPTKQWSKRDPAGIKGVVIHQTGGGSSVDGLAKYHLGPNHISKDGLPGIAYVFFINKLGEVFLVNDIESATWSHGDASKPGDENALFLSACFGGQFIPWPGSVDNPTPLQITTMHKLWRVLKAIFDLTDVDLYGHYDFGKEACPGRVLKAIIKAYNGLVTTTFEKPETRQRALQERGFYAGAIDGQFGPKSIAALKKFLADRNLPVTDAWTYLATAEMIRLRVTGD